LFVFVYFAKNSASWLRYISKLSGCTIRRQSIFLPEPESKKMAGYPANRNRISGTSLAHSVLIWQKVEFQPKFEGIQRYAVSKVAAIKLRNVEGCGNGT